MEFISYAFWIKHLFQFTLSYCFLIFASFHYLVKCKFDFRWVSLWAFSFSHFPYAAVTMCIIFTHGELQFLLFIFFSKEYGDKFIQVILLFILLFHFVLWRIIYWILILWIRLILAFWIRIFWISLFRRVFFVGVFLVSR